MLGCRDLRIGPQLCPFTEGDAVAQKGKWLAEVMALVARVGNQGLPLLQLDPHFCFLGSFTDNRGRGIP